MGDPRVLLVDDQRQVTRMLRSSLELSGRSYDILDVASAEEALREVERGPVDLIVTDLRLPEMSGLELVARIRQTHPKMHAILVTGQPTRQVEAQARALGVVAFIPKPVSTALFLQAVDDALRRGAEGRPPPEIAGDKARAAERLMTMRRELGARAAILVSLSGEMLLRAGDEESDEIDRAMKPAVETLAAGVRASRLQGAASPVNFLYLDGDPYRLYLTNIGEAQGLVIGFGGSQEAWQMGAIFHYARRVIDELREVLPTLGGKKDAAPETRAAAPARSQKAFDEPPTTPHAVQDFWEQAADSSAGQAPGKDGALSYEQARKLGLIPDDSKS
jgi:CheY-like chemotaxis protein